MLQTTLVWRCFFEDTNNNQGYIFYDCAAVTKYADIYLVNMIYIKYNVCFRAEHMVNQTQVCII